MRDRLTSIRDFPEPVRDAAMATDAVVWGELVGLELSGRSLEANAGVNFVYLIEKLPTEELVDFRYLLREHFGTERRGEGEDEDMHSVVAHLVEVLEHEIAGRWGGLRGKVE